MHANGAHERWRLSWEEAKQAAGVWIGLLHLPRKLEGASVDLRPIEDKLPGTLGFQKMVVIAAVRKLKKRGAGEIVEPVLPEE